MDLDDAELVRRVLSGDVPAYRHIVERHQGRIMYLGLKFLRSWENAEDFSQEVFLRAFEKLSLFEGRGSFAAWLYRLAYNLAVNRCRGAREAAMTGALDEEAVADKARPIEEVLVSAEAARQVDRALEELPAHAALIVKMHYFDGLSYPEISEILDMPVNTVKSHIFRAKRIVRERLEGRGEQ